MRTMDLKRIFRGPLVYIVIAIVVVWVGSSLLTGTGFRSVSTETGLQLLKDGKVATAKVVDTDNRVDLTLKQPDGANGTNVQFNFVTARGPQVVAPALVVPGQGVLVEREHAVVARRVDARVLDAEAPREVAGGERVCHRVTSIHWS